MALTAQLFNDVCLCIPDPEESLNKLPVQQPSASVHKEWWGWIFLFRAARKTHIQMSSLGMFKWGDVFPLIALPRGFLHKEHDIQFLLFLETLLFLTLIYFTILCMYTMCFGHIHLLLPLKYPLDTPTHTPSTNISFLLLLLFILFLHTKVSPLSSSFTFLLYPFPSSPTPTSNPFTPSLLFPFG